MLSNTVKLLTTNRVFFSFIVSGRLFREKWSAIFYKQMGLILRPEPPTHKTCSSKIDTYRTHKNKKNCILESFLQAQSHYITFLSFNLLFLRHYSFLFQNKYVHLQYKTNREVHSDNKKNEI